MPRQNTFTVVPNPLGMQGLISRDDAPAAKPQAMTSKQAKKLYKQATKQPRLSKAEQRRLELEEQERIRKELDKQKSANKARIAREKKKAKELAEIQARKKKGLPLVDVHPSQDTISRFVRVGAVNTATKRDSSGNVKGKAGEHQIRTVSPERDDSNKENIPNGGGEVGESLRKRPRLDQDSQPKKQDAATIPCKESTSGVEDTTNTDKENVPPVEDKTENTNQRTSQPGRPGKEGPQSDDKTNKRTESNTQRLEAPGEVVMVMSKPIRLQPDRHLEDMGLSRPQSGVAALQPKQQEDAPPKPGVVKKVVKPLPTGMRPRPILGVTDGNRPSTPNAVKETGPPPQSYQQSEHVNKGKEQQIPKENSQRMPKASTPNTSVVLSAVEASKVLPDPQPHISSIPPPRPSISARQPVDGARPNPSVPKHLATAQANPTRPAHTTANPNKFASPYRPMGPPALVPQRPSPGPPSLKKPMARPSSGGIQKPTFLPRNHLQASASRASLPSNIGKPAVPTNNAPPTSTQLFVMSHLDDLLPSPSQELRELEEDNWSTPTSRPPVYISLSDSQRQAPVDVSKSPLAPGPRRFARQTSHVQIAPQRPRIQEVKLVEDDIFPFLSTQDLLFSSQDIRELESDTPTKVDNGKEGLQPTSKPSSKTASSSPPILTNKGHRPSQSATTTPGPKPVPGLASQKQTTSVPALLRQSSTGSVTLNSQATSTAYQAQRPSVPASITPDPKTATVLAASEKQAEATSAPSNQSPRPRASASSTPKLSPAIENDQQAELPNPSLPTAPAATPPAPKPVPPPRSPSPQRFFGSSGVGIQILLAMAESEKTFREDEERRQEKARRAKLAEERRKKAAEERARKAAEEKRKRATEERAAVMEKLRRQGEEIAQLKIPLAKRTESPVLVAPEQRPAATQARQLPGQSIKQLIPSISKVKRSISGWVPPQRTSMAKPVVEADRPQQSPPPPPPPKSNGDAKHQPPQAAQVTKTTPVVTPNPNIQAQDQISQILKVSPAPSQETDYGDEDLDALGELGGMGLTQFLGPEKDLSWLDDDDDDF